MTRYFLRLSFDGTRYHGWQRQPNAITVQQTLEDAISMMLRSEIKLTGAGRTDSGVHADEYFAHFDFGGPLLLSDQEKLVFRLNSYLSADISIDRIFPVFPGIHARFSAFSRTYKYYIARHKNPFRIPYTWFYHGGLDIARMNEGAKMVMEALDFTSFSKADTDAKTNLCHVTYAFWQEEAGELVFTITANRFLRNMVRAIVGTLLDLGKDRMDMGELNRIITSKSRSDAGESVPAKGLHLVRVEYPGNITCC